jgi:DNA polymerase
MPRKPTATPGSPTTAQQAGDTLAALRAAAAHCTDCPLYKDATQTVFGEGPENARILMVGEQPGDQEDKAGHPFVGPAGRLLDEALVQAGVDRRKVYVTNAVKHFKFELRGKRRLHKTPAQAEVAACLEWLEREIELVEPKLLVALGATAARAVTGRATPVGANRGKLLEHSSGAALLITVHPSFLLRMPPEDRDGELRKFVADLKLAAPFAHKR